VLRCRPLDLDARRHEITPEFVFRGERVGRAAPQAKIGHSRRAAARVRIDVIELETTGFATALAHRIDKVQRSPSRCHTSRRTARETYRPRWRGSAEGFALR
jgi:hypothetical protein